VKTRLQAVRHEFGWSQDRVIRELKARARQIGEVLGSDASLKTEISRHENAQVEPGPEWQRLYRLVYGRTDADLGFVDERQPVSADRTDEFTARLAAARSLSLRDVELMRGQLDHIRALDRQLGAPAVLEQLRALMATMSQLLAHSLRPAVRESLAGALADAGALAGWQALDVGAIEQAWQDYELAKLAARESGSEALLAHAIGEQACVLLDVGEHTQAVDLIGEACAVARGHSPPLLTAWLHATEAEAQSECGEDTECRRALDKAAAALPVDRTDPALPFIFLSDEHFDRWRGNCLARLGDPSAIEHLIAALTVMDASFARAEAGLRCDLAQAMIIRGEFDEAQVHARRARQLATRVGSVRQRRRVERLASVPGPLLGHGDVMRLDRRRSRGLRALSAARQDVKEADEGPRAEDLVLADQIEDGRHRYPCDAAGFLSVRRITDVGRAMAQVDLVRGVHHADHRLEGKQVL
jgi:hypothetical protein